jgi:hypothetical protein
MNPFPYLIVAVLAIAAVLMMAPRERFQPEFLDKTQVAKTVAVEDSSYAQRTNHVDPAPYSMGPIAGMQTPFQVNQYRAYVV